jgi:hypothetical protein
MLPENDEANRGQAPADHPPPLPPAEAKDVDDLDEEDDDGTPSMSLIPLSFFMDEYDNVTPSMTLIPTSLFLDEHDNDSQSDYGSQSDKSGDELFDIPDHPFPDD